MAWTIVFSRKSSKQAEKLSDDLLTVLRLLFNDLECKGPAPGKNWSNYGKLHGKKNEDKRHCHLIKGNPTYVCCWDVISKENKLIEVYYAGTHEKAPY